MRSTKFWRASLNARSGRVLRAMLAAVLLLSLVVSEAPAQRLDGFNVVAVPGHPYGGASARRALAEAKRIGAKAIAIIPFLWQASAASPTIGRGTDMTDDELRAAIRDVHALKLRAVVKPHVWVPTSWAGAVAMDNDDAWRIWFANYGRELQRIAVIAAEEKADALVIGTELARTTQRPEWVNLIAIVRAAFPGEVFYVAHNDEEAEAIPFWNDLDAIGVSLYPPLGADTDREARLLVMRDVADRLDTLAARTGKPIVVAEVGLRSARGSAAKPWESPEERDAAPDAPLQAEVLADWLAVLDRPTIQGVLVWRWFTDPDAGGPADTDFTVQGKPAEDVLSCAWLLVCSTR
jgi:hypothetical protein